MRAASNGRLRPRVFKSLSHGQSQTSQSTQCRVRKCPKINPSRTWHRACRRLRQTGSISVGDNTDCADPESEPAAPTRAPRDSIERRAPVGPASLRELGSQGSSRNRSTDGMRRPAGPHRSLGGPVQAVARQVVRISMHIVGRRRFHAGVELFARVRFRLGIIPENGPRASGDGRRAPAGCSGLRSNYHEQSRSGGT